MQTAISFLIAMRTMGYSDNMNKLKQIQNLFNMRKEEVIRFLQLVMYYEVLPLNTEVEADYSTIGKYCLRTGFVNATPDGNYIIATKGWDLLTDKIQWDDQLPFLSTHSPVSDKAVKTTYWLAGAAVGGILVYELVIKVIFR